MKTILKTLNDQERNEFYDKFIHNVDLMNISEKHERDK
jgi:hypothetical protein